jgi:uncharacterized protein YjiS (DUF1127 family)
MLFLALTLAAVSIGIYGPILVMLAIALKRYILQRWHLATFRRHVRRDLSRMTDRELADIGLTRCDIDRIARGEL